MCAGCTPCICTLLALAHPALRLHEAQHSSGVTQSLAGGRYRPGDHCINVTLCPKHWG